MRMDCLSNRKPWLDSAKGICMLMVLLFHIEMYSFGTQRISSLFTSFFMQAFFLLSGYTFVKDVNNFNWKSKIKSSLRGLAYPYFMILFLFGVIKVFIGTQSVYDTIVQLISGGGSWFVYVLLFVQILSSIAIAFLPYRILCLWLSGIVFWLLGWFLCDKTLPSWSGSVSAILRFYIFFIIGVTLSVIEFSYIKYEKYLSVLCLLLFMVFWGIDNKINLDGLGALYGCRTYWTYGLCGLFGSLFLFFAIRQWKGFLWLRFIGYNSLLFYFFNGCVIKILNKWMLSFAISVRIPLLLILSIITLSIFSVLIRCYVPFIIIMPSYKHEN